MGMTRGDLGILASRAKMCNFHGHLLCLGRQDILVNSETAAEVFKKHGISATSPWPKGRLDDQQFFKAFGFSTVDSIDYDDFEGATIIHNLNLCIPANLAGRFDYIVDGGTSEHVFNFSQALKNYHSMLDVGGKIIHFVPSSNAMDHGFYSFSPTLFQDYYLRNNWKIIDIFIYSYRPYTWLLPFHLYKYNPETFRATLYANLPVGRAFGVCCIAEKLPNSTCCVDDIVQQSYIAKASGLTSDSNNKNARGLRNIAHNIMGIIKPIIPVRLYDYYIGIRMRLRANTILRKFFMGCP
jgi:hypothetical protein